MFSLTEWSKITKFFLSAKFFSIFKKIDRKTNFANNDNLLILNVIKKTKMKSIPLTENEVKHIRETYELELERLQKRTTEISGILKKLKGITTDDVSREEETKAELKKDKLTKTEKLSKFGNPQAKAETKIKGKRGRPAKVKTEQTTIANDVATAEQTAPKKRGRKPSLKKNIEETAQVLPLAKTVKVRKNKAEAKPVKTKKAAVKAEQKKEPKKRGRKPSVKNNIEETAQASPLAKTVKVRKNKAEVKPVKTKKAAVKAEQKKEPKKRGRKPSDDSKKARWTASILDILNEKGKVLPSKEIISQVLKLQDIPASELQKAKGIITGSLSELKLKAKKLKTMSVSGKKGELYGLSNWFNELGQLIEPSRL
jgi:hypothetical protein